MEGNDQARLVDQGFQAILGESPTVLILGTMPSVQSLKSQQYYGHPRNAFWWIMAQICQFDAQLNYSERVEYIKTKHIAVWDVIAACHRPGSLDSRIDQQSVIANPLADFFKVNSELKLLVFNGQAAAKLFSKFFGAEAWFGETLILPSTSPANAAMTKEQKLERWRAIEPYLNN